MILASIPAPGSGRGASPRPRNASDAHNAAPLRPALVHWLLACPELTGISTLALDAGACGLLDLEDAMARAVAANVRLTCAGEGPRWQPPAFHLRQARMMSRTLKGCHLQIAKDTVVVAGTLARGIAVSQSRDMATLHVRGDVPATVCAALPGMRLDRLIQSDRIPLDRYRITGADQDEFGLNLTFKVPRMPIDMAHRAISGAASRLDDVGVGHHAHEEVVDGHTQG